MTRRGQATVETVIAVLAVTFVFFVLFRLSHLLLGKIMLEHAAMRVARARAVGFNDFMCLKAARVAAIPISGRRLWPEERFGEGMETGRVRVYMESPDEPRARGLLEYEGWHFLKVNASTGDPSTTALRDDTFRNLEGKAAVKDGCACYLQ